MAISVISNVVFLHQRYAQPWVLKNSLPTRYAHLPRETIKRFPVSSDFASTNRTIQDNAWEQPDVDWGAHVVALDQSHVSALGLPKSQPSLWDPAKSLYVLNGAHELHCLHLLRRSINEFYDGVPIQQQTTPYGHVLHCIDALRESVMCNADDTPLYMGRWDENAKLNLNLSIANERPGVGSERKCRNWGAMLSWSRQHSACYKPVHFGDKSFPSEERFKFCPDGSKPWLVDRQVV
ncbi:hypothetical protein K461DRAFT_297611 [Myriangium duriaei CBS 260.36]|uniref:Uncharacterized protein n=1 Tax=Myriangium duriaei CBS 260.36 TaxID=1168546 RepID=A0A9P4IVB6_9PEZI|nr:hypothetical protein K461DRAFT_297611 [Myriangium duriaei CBS 260.36]